MNNNECSKLSATMKRHVLTYLTLYISLSFASFGYTQERDLLRADRPSSYTVVKGDTLWGIAQQFLNDPWRWKQIWQGNSQIENPDLIYPGDVIRLIFVDGKPQLVIDNAATPANNTAPAPSTERAQPQSRLKTVKLSPQVYAQPVKRAIPAIPLERINKFLLGNRVVGRKTLKNAPHVVAGKEGRIALSAGDTFYGRGDFADSITSYSIYRKGPEYIDPETKKVLGVQAIDIGAANIVAKNDGDTSTFGITRSTLEVRAGDRLLASEERQITSTFLPTAPKQLLAGSLMSVETGVSQAGRLDIVSINLGKQENLVPGHVLAIYKKGANIKDRFSKKRQHIALPDSRAGLIMVFQTFDTMSLAIVLDAEKGVVVGDMVRTP